MIYLYVGYKKNQNKLIKRANLVDTENRLVVVKWEKDWRWDKWVNVVKRYTLPDVK